MIFQLKSFIYNGLIFSTLFNLHSVTSTKSSFSTNYHLQHNDIPAQRAFYVNERVEFGISDEKQPFNGVFDEINYGNYPIRYSINNDPKNQTFTDEPRNSFMQILYDIKPDKNLTKLPLLHPITMNIIKPFTDAIFKLSGWSHRTYVPPNYTNETEPLQMRTKRRHHIPDAPDAPKEVIYYLHGLNPLNGIENIQFVGQLSEHLDVNIIMNQNLLCNNHLTNESFSSHLSSIIQFINNDFNDPKNKYTDYHLIGDSYGSIRLAILARSNPELFDSAKSIVWVDPLSINLPYSPTFVRVWECVFNSCSGVQDPIITLMNHDSQWTFLYNEIDMYDWSIDSNLLYRYADKCSVIIGLNDIYIDMNQTSPVAMNSCKFHYTDDVHGAVLFNDLNKFVNIIEYPKKGLVNGFTTKIFDKIRIVAYIFIRNVVKW